MADSEQWSDLLDQFRCLWDQQHPSFDDAHKRNQAYQTLLRKYNRRAGPIDLVSLKLWIASIHRRKTGRKDISVCTKCITKSEDIAPWLPDFPCLWDFQDLNYFNKSVKDRCLKQMLEKYNNNRVKKIGELALSLKLDRFNQNRLRCSRANTDQIGQPRELRCDLDSPFDNEINESLSNVRVETVQPYNTNTSSIDTNRLKRKLRSVAHQRLMSRETTEQLSELMKDYPYLWDPQDLNFLNNSLKARAREQLLERYNAVSSTPLNMEELKRKIELIRCQNQTKIFGRRKNPSTERWHRMIQEFPCLCDSQHPDFLVEDKKDRARYQLLAKYNDTSSVPIDMKKLKKKIWEYRTKQKQAAKALDLTIHNLQHSEDSQNSQTNPHCTESSNNEVYEVPHESTHVLQHSDYEMDCDTEYENDDVKTVPISVTDTEFVKQSINLCVKETNEGKRRVYVDLHSFSSLLSCDDSDRNNDNENNCRKDSLTETEIDLTTDYTDDTANNIARIDSKIDINLNSSFSSSRANNYRNDEAINFSLESPETEIDLTDEDRNDVSSNDAANIYEGIPMYETRGEVESIGILHSDVGRTVTDAKRIGTFSESSEFASEMWYSVELPNIFR